MLWTTSEGKQYSFSILIVSVMFEIFFSCLWQDGKQSYITVVILRGTKSTFASFFSSVEISQPYHTPHQSQNPIGHTFFSIFVVEIQFSPTFASQPGGISLLLTQLPEITQQLYPLEIKAFAMLHFWCESPIIGLWMGD